MEKGWMLSEQLVVPLMNENLAYV